MQLIVNNMRFNDPTPLNLLGGEGELYALNSENVAKVYHEKERSNAARKQKVLALCNSFQNTAARSGVASVAFPEFPAYELAVSFDTLVGFSMRWFKDCPPIVALGYNLSTHSFNEKGGVRFDDSSALGFVYNVFELVEQLHQARIILGDVNPGNILYNQATRRPVIIDVDSAQIGSFGCPATHELYNDPRLQQRGKNLGGGLTFDAGTDTFALAVVCFEFLVGCRPFQIYVTPLRPKGEVENKLKGISNIKCISLGHTYLGNLGVAYLDCPENQAVERRLAELKSKDSRLYNFFVGIFVKDERDSLLFSLPLTDPRHPGNRFLIESGFKVVIDEEAMKRKQFAAVQTRQGATHRASTLPDSGFRQIISSIAPNANTNPSPATQIPNIPVASRKPPVLRADPAEFNLVLQHFGLKVI